MRFTIFFLAIFFTAVFAQYQGPCSAIAIPGPYNFTTVRGNNFNATSIPESNVNCYVYSQRGVAWYTISSPNSINVEISTCNVGTDYDTTLFVSTGTGCSALNCIIGNDDANCEIADEASFVSFSMTANTVYYVGVGGYTNGEFTLTIEDQSNLDNCNNAKAIQAPYFPPVTVYGTNGNAASGYEDCYLSYPQKPLWFTITPTIGLPMSITTCGANTTVDSTISLFGGSCAALSCIAYSDDACDGSGSLINFTPALPSYLVAVSGYGSNVGNLAVTFSQTLPSSCSSPYPISVGDTITQPLTGQPTINNDPCSLITGEPGYWFLLNNLSTTKTATVSTCSFNTNYDTTIAVYSGSCSSLRCVGSNDDFTCVVTGSTITSQVSFTPAPSTSYYAVVSGFGAARGIFSLSLSQ